MALTIVVGLRVLYVSTVAGLLRWSLIMDIKMEYPD
jgi:hypothetical protein